MVGSLDAFTGNMPLLLPKQQGVDLTGCNRTGPPCSVGRPTVHAPDNQPACPPAALRQRQMTDASEQNNTSPLGSVIRWKH